MMGGLSDAAHIVFRFYYKVPRTAVFVLSLGKGAEGTESLTNIRLSVHRSLFAAANVRRFVLDWYDCSQSEKRLTT